MSSKTNRVTPSHATSGRDKRKVSSKEDSNKGSGHGHATKGAGAARQTTTGSGSGSNTKPKPQGDKAAKDSSSSPNKKGHRPGGSPNGSSNGSSGGSPDGKSKKDKKTKEELLEYQALSVIVFKGFPYDSKDKRHCALFIEHLDATGHVWRRNMIDIEGSEGHWRGRESVDRDPERSLQCDAKLPIRTFMVGLGTQGRNDRQLRNSIYNAPINNDWDEWNCQSWVDGALRRLVRANLLTENEAEAAISVALDWVVRAEFEPRAIAGSNSNELA